MDKELNALKNDIKSKGVVVLSEQNRLKNEILSGKWNNIDEVLSKEEMTDYFKKADDYIKQKNNEKFTHLMPEKEPTTEIKPEEDINIPQEEISSNIAKEIPQKMEKKKTTFKDIIHKILRMV